MMILPVFSWILYLFLSLVERVPQVWNTGVMVTEENRERVYRILKNLLSTIKLLIIALVTWLTITTSLAMQLTGWFTLAVLVLVFGDLIFWIVKLCRNR